MSQWLASIEEVVESYGRSDCDKESAYQKWLHKHGVMHGGMHGGMEEPTPGILAVLLEMPKNSKKENGGRVAQALT